MNWHHLLGRQIYYHYTIPTQRRVCVTIASGQIANLGLANLYLTSRSTRQKWHPRRNSNPDCWFRRPKYSSVILRGYVVGTARVELAYQRYQHCGLPLTYAPIMVRAERIGRSSHRPKRRGLPLT